MLYQNERQHKTNWIKKKLGNEKLSLCYRSELNVRVCSNLKLVA